MQRLTRNFALTTAAVYALFGVLWILFSDRLLAALVVDPLRITTWQTYKGWAFVIASTVLIYWLLRRFMRAQRASDLKVHALNRVYAVLSDVNHTIVRERDPQALFTRICTIAVDRGGWRMAWIGLLDEASRAVKPVAHAGIVDGYLEALKIVLDDSPAGQGPTASALRDGQHIIVNDIEHDPRMGPWRSRALALGYRASAAFPFMVAGQMHGALNLYAAERDAFDATEISLLDKMAMDIAFALEFNAQEGQRRHAEQILRESEARYRHVSSAISDIAYACATDNAGDYAIEWMTGAAEAITGYTHDEIIARRCWGFLIVEEDLPHFHAQVTELEPGNVGSCELRLRHKDGQVIWVLSTAECVADDHTAHARHLYGGLVDITKRKRAEDALRASEAALRRSQQVAQVGHWTWDTPTNRVTWSAEMFRIFGVDRDTFDGDLDAVIRRSIHPDDAERVMQMNEAVTLDGRPQETEYRVVWPDGSIHHVWAMPADSVVDEDGAIVQLSGVVQEITERKHAEGERERLLQQVQAQAEQMAQIMNSVPEGVMLLDADCCILMANPHARAQLQSLAGAEIGATLTHLAGRPIDALLTSPPVGQWHVLEAGPRTFELIARPVETGPRPGGWVLVMRDITELRAVEQQLQRQERMVAIGQLAAGIAHDFNNIMSVITLYAQMIAKTAGLDDRGQARLATIEQQAMRATEMIRQILDFSRRTVTARHTLDLLALLRQQVELLKRTLPESVEIELTPAPGAYFVMGDSTRLQQMMMNLAFNARDAMPEGGKLQLGLTRLTVRTKQDAPLHGMAAGEWVQFTIADTGAGMPQAVIDHIFEPFFTTKEPGKGTGLGLAQVYGIVGQHDGHITVVSQPGKGTTFTIYLPALSGVEGDSARVEPATLLPLGNGESILVVEDDVKLRATVVELLESWNYRVAQATNGADALTRLVADDEPIDLILSDVVMPTMGGVAMFKTLRQRGIQKPVILLSGHPLAQDIDELRTFGLFAWLAKPPDTHHLAHTIAAALHTGR